MCLFLAVSSAPDSVMLSSSISSPILSASIGSTISLNCTVKLNPLLNVEVNVATEWTGPAGFMITNTAQSVMGSTTTYISSVMVSSFGREQSGIYNCTATASSSSPFLIDSGSQSRTSSARVTVGKTMNHCNHYHTWSMTITI